MSRVHATRSARVHPTRASTINVSRLTKGELEAWRRLYPDIDHERPRTRAECADGPRPCPYVSCQYHLFLDVAENGNIKLNFPDIEPDQLAHSCSLDVADRGGATLEEVAALMNLTRERIRQIEVLALAWAARSRALRAHLGEGELRPVRRLPVLPARSAA